MSGMDMGPSATCPVCETPTAIVEGHFTEPRYVDPWVGSVCRVRPPTLVGWTLACGHLVEGEAWHLRVEPDGSARFVPSG